MSRRISLVLVHHPVVDRSGAVITTAVTNLDLHDMARSSRAYGLEAMYAVHPVAAQRDLIDRVRAHWIDGSGARRIPDRVPAMELLRAVPSLDDVYAAVGPGRSSVEVWVTSARRLRTSLTFSAARERLGQPGKPVLLLFGTGWGLASEVVEDADVCLEPIKASVPTGFNHLSVRAACAIAFDRLLGERTD